MHIAAKLVAAGALVLLGGCSTLSSLNPFARKAPPLNPPAALVDFKPSLALRTAWSVSIGSGGPYLFSPAAANHSVFAAAADGSLIRVDAASGGTLWRINAGSPLTAGVGTDGNTVAVAAEKGVLLVFDGDGKLRWKAQASSEILSAPAVGQGLVIVRSLDNHIVAYDANSGARRWAVQRAMPPLTLRTAPGMVISGETVFVALPGGRLSALALGNGGPRWEVAVGDPRGTTELERIADTSGSPVLLEREVCAVAYQGSIGCFDASTGAARWIKQFSSYVGVAVDQRLVFAADERGAVTAFSRQSGASAWRNDKLAFRRLSSPAAFGRAVAVGDYQGYIHFLSREDGALIGRVGTDGSPILTGPVDAGGKLVFQTQAGTVVALTTE
ncbi:MAG TPA: outer membrane protein assembly factor BamB [Burkholderiaceae bacterium]|nr:outer membrane protein assembly factor BamB [Burkholderiaceae bacterium]